MPTMIKLAEQDVMKASAEVDQAEAALQDKQAFLTLSGAIDGKNAEVRSAQMWEQTKAERSALNEVRERLQKARMQLAYQQNRFAALKTIARLMAGEVE